MQGVNVLRMHGAEQEKRLDVAKHWGSIPPPSAKKESPSDYSDGLLRCVVYWQVKQMALCRLPISYRRVAIDLSL